MKHQVDAYNAQPGELKGYHCQICKNKGWVAVAVDGDMRMKRCSCIKERETLKQIQSAGLVNIQQYTFGSYRVWDANSRLILETVQKWLARRPLTWLYLGGQSGAGKTHICTAAVMELMRQGHHCHYFPWVSGIRGMKLLMHDNPGKFQEWLERLKNTEVLYIDDFFKGSVSEADKSLAIDIIGYRYNDRSKVTIISSEFYLEELRALDEALMGRIYERAVTVVIRRDKKKNYRVEVAHANPKG